MTAVSPGPRPADERARLAMAVAASPGDPALRRALAVNLARSGEFRPALEQYRALLALRPNDPDITADAGLTAIKGGLEEEILPLLRSAAAANPGHPRVWQVLGLMLRELDDLAPAIDAFGNAARLAPRDPLIAHGFARSRFDAGRPAVPEFEQARRVAPTDQSILIGLVAALVADGRSDDAVTLAKAELDRHPDWIAVQATLARHLWSMGDHDSFTDSIEAALRSAPRNVMLWKELIIILMHAGLYEEALAAIARGRTAAGAHLVFDANEAISHAELGHFEEADRLFARLRGVGDPIVIARHVRHLLRTGRPEEAERIALPVTRTPAANELWPYVSIAWRMTGNPAWQWLEGDPRLVGTYDLADAVPSLDVLADSLRALHVTTHQPLEQSLRGGTQTDGNLFRRTEPEIRSLRAAIVEAVRQHVDQLPPVDPRHPVLSLRGGRIRFSGSWSVRLTSGGSHANHIHPAGWFSSAFYVALPDIDDRGPEPAGWLTLGEPQAELHLDLPPVRLVEPKPGRLVLFPSTMWHGTRPFSVGERLTVAFDVAPPC